MRTTRKNKRKKLLSLLLAVCMTVSLSSYAAIAMESEDSDHMVTENTDGTDGGNGNGGTADNVNDANNADDMDNADDADNADNADDADNADSADDENKTDDADNVDDADNADSADDENKTDDADNVVDADNADSADDENKTDDADKIEGIVEPAPIAAAIMPVLLTVTKPAYTHWLLETYNGVDTISGAGALIGNQNGAWYTYCVDEKLAYPRVGTEFTDSGESGTLAYELPFFQESDESVSNGAQLARILEAGYPLESVTAIRAIADNQNLSAAARATSTQLAVWAITENDPQKYVGDTTSYAYALYEYGVSGTVGGKPVADLAKISVEGVDANGQLNLTQQEATANWVGEITLSAVPADLKVLSITGDVAVSIGGTELKAGDLVTASTLSISADSADAKGAISFTYNARTQVGADMKLFATDAVTTSGKAFQRMLGYQTQVVSDTLMLAVGVNQPAPDPTPNPGPNPDPTPDPGPNPDPTPNPGPNPDPTPDPGPSPDPTPGAGDGGDNDVPAVREEEIPEVDTPLADLPIAEDPTEDVPELTDLIEEEVPLAEVPKTGDAGLFWALAAFGSLIGLVALNFPAKRRKDA